MKKMLLSMAILAGTLGAAHAQIIPNPGFENWTNHGSYDDPDGWDSVDSLISTLGGTTFPVQKSTDVRPGSTGTYSLKLENVMVGPDTVSGAVSRGVFPGSYGMPYTGRPDTFKFWTKYIPNGVDTFLVAAVLTRWDAGTNSQVQIGVGGAQMMAGIPTWTEISGPFQYNESTSPDSISFLIWLIGEGNHYTLGSVAYVDDLSFIGGGVSTPAAPSNLTATVLKTGMTGAISLTWNDNANNELGFYVERSTDGSSYSPIDTLGIDDEAFTDSGLSDGTQYFYRVIAYNASGSSSPSNSANATTVGIADNALNAAVRVYPNPAENVLNVKLDQFNNTRIVLSTATGQIVYESTMNSANEVLNVASLSKGLYLLQVVNDNGTAVKKVILQ